MTDDTIKEAAVKAATPKKPAAKKRKTLTPAERIAKAEADLAALREKAQAGDRKQLAKVDEALAKAVTQRDEATSKVNALTAEKQTIQARLDAGVPSEG